ncbi:MAG: hypothetical protein FRX48_05367 [Lasallia pustulata]|uniref:Uncharacterized protein n=1 Tax=Lasallia pustulata TaxID=136370 RepID=A0A5M8PR67_9LECA|nr:MAG: hypothetical protein FRX48_05367 [Lasallia pustulata]
MWPQTRNLDVQAIRDGLPEHPAHARIHCRTKPEPGLRNPVLEWDGQRGQSSLQWLSKTSSQGMRRETQWDFRSTRTSSLARHGQVSTKVYFPKFIPGQAEYSGHEHRTIVSFNPSLKVVYIVLHSSPP